jgi:hypothetical protein
MQIVGWSGLGRCLLLEIMPLKFAQVKKIGVKCLADEISQSNRRRQHECG